MVNYSNYFYCSKKCYQYTDGILLVDAGPRVEYEIIYDHLLWQFSCFKKWPKVNLT